MTDRLALPRRYRNQLEALLSKHVPGVEVWAYGSRVNGESHDGSDLDLALRGPALEPLDGGFYDLLEAIEKSNIPILVQAHDWAMLPESFHREIERDYVVVQEAAKRTAAGEWREVTLGAVLTLQRGFDLPTTQRKPGSYPVIASTGPVGTHGEAMVRGPGVVIGRSGSLGGGQFVEHDFWPLNTTLWVKDFKGNDPRFCYYLLKSIDLAQFNVGSGVPTLNRNHIHPFPVFLPPLPTQRAIAHILGTLDDKIELNRRMNETLEGMARALFQSWFVDFEPVRAKMEGWWRRGESLPGLPADLYDLFPDRLVDSDLGEVPEGWGVKALRYCIHVERGLSYKGSGLSSAGVPMHNLNSVYEGGGYKDDGIKYYKGDFQERHVTQPGDVLVANTEQGHDRLLIGFAAVVPRRFGDRGLFSHHLYRVRPKGGSGLSASFVCQLLNTKALHDIVSGYATGTTVNMLPVDALRIPPIVTPPVQLVTTYNAIAEVARARQEQFIEESRSLGCPAGCVAAKAGVGGHTGGNRITHLITTKWKRTS